MYMTVILTDDKAQRLIEYSIEYNIGLEKQIKDGKIIKQTLDDIMESKMLLDMLINEAG